MVFSSLFFTFSFLPLVLLLYFIAKEPYRNYMLLAASLLFYAYGEPAFVFVMIASIAVNYGLAVWIAGKKQENSKRFAGCLLAAAVVANIGILFIFKYLDFAITSLNLFFHTNYQIRGIALPIGISFFTFQALSYVIDVYRGTVKVQKNPLYLALYISFFPQLIAGPIVRYSDIEKQLIDRTCTPEGFAEGARRFMLGFCKKVILANNLAIPATAIFNMDAIMAPPSSGSVPSVTASRFFMTFQAIPIWQSASAKYSDSTFRRTFVILTSPNPSRNFGADGIFLSDNGSGITSIFRSEAQKSPFQSTYSTCLSYGV